MAFDKELYWARRNAGLNGTGGGKRKKEQVRRYTKYEIEAMEYHRLVKEAYLAGKITEEQAKEELLDGSKAAAENLIAQNTPEIIVTCVEQLMIHGSYEAIQAFAAKHNIPETGPIPEESK